MQQWRPFMHDRISIDPHVCHGQACIRGTRIPVHQIVRMLANGDTIEELLEEYPHLQRKDIYAALDYAGTLAEELVTPFVDIPPSKSISSLTRTSPNGLSARCAKLGMRCS